ncbi:hypothetical protein Dimus_022060 [Dionaea muscipula]
MREASWFPVKATRISLYITTAACVGVGTVAVSFPGDSSLKITLLPDEIRVGLNVLARSCRAIFTIAANVVDYKYSLHELAEGSHEYRHKLSEVC